jgi:streptogramin lyase
MKTLLCFVTSVIVVFSCDPHQEKSPPNFSVPEVVKALGFNVPVDSVVLPRKVPAGKPTVVWAGNFNKIRIPSNVHPIPKPKVVLAGSPKICILGKDNISMPKTKMAIVRPFIGGIPETVIAKEPFFKEQNPQNFSIFGKLQGLNHLEITCMLEDKKGNVWFGTAGGGVSKYDGKSFTHYTDKEGLSNNIIWSIMEDKNGNIWFGTFGRGVSKYDGRTFTQFTEQEGLSNNNVWTLLEDKNGHIWMGTSSGVNRYDGKSFTYYTLREGMSSNKIAKILEDKSGNIWFGTIGGGVNKFDGKSFTHFTEKEGLSHNNVRSILEDKNGNLWFGTSDGGVNKFD